MPQDSISQGELPGGPVSHKVQYRVIYGDTDKAGVMYYGNYFRLFEIGRTELLRCRLDLPYSRLEEMGIIFPVVEAYARYKASAHYDDLLEIETRLENNTRVSISFSYEIWREDKLLVSGHTKHASVDPTGRLIKIPQGIMEALAAR